jgi:hypothetical protein
MSAADKDNFDNQTGISQLVEFNGVRKRRNNADQQTASTQHLCAGDNAVAADQATCTSRSGTTSFASKPIAIKTRRLTKIVAATAIVLVLIAAVDRFRNTSASPVISFWNATFGRISRQWDSICSGSSRQGVGSASGESNTQPAEMVVKGIVHGSGEPMALVATQIVRKGQVVLGATVTEIGKDYVNFEHSGREWTQTIGQRPPE